MIEQKLVIVVEDIETQVKAMDNGNAVTENSCNQSGTAIGIVKLGMVKKQGH